MGKDELIMTREAFEKIHKSLYLRECKEIYQRPFGEVPDVFWNQEAQRFETSQSAKARLNSLDDNKTR